MFDTDTLFRVLENGIQNIIDHFGKMDYIHLLLMSALAVAFVIVIFGVIRQAIRKKMEFFWGTLAAICAGLVLFFCVMASSAGTVVSFRMKTRKALRSALHKAVWIRSCRMACR